MAFLVLVETRVVPPNDETVPGGKVLMGRGMVPLLVTEEREKREALGPAELRETFDAE